MGKYEFNIAKATGELLPPDKRYKNNSALIQSLLSGVQWAHNLLFDNYYNGDLVPDYSTGTYNYQDKVQFNKKIYSSLVDNNTDVPTAGTWIMVQENFIGVKQRIKYNGGKLVLEYALNTAFITNFRQPPNTSDIFITNNDPVISGFIVGATEAHSSSVGQTTSSDMVGYSNPFVYQNNFTINIPALSLAATNETSIRNFVNQYIPAGLFYEIKAY